MNILWAIIIGFVVGALAKLIMPGKDPGGFVITTLLGIAGSLLATWIGHAAGWYQPGQNAGFIGALIGAIVILSIYRLLFRPRPRYTNTTARHGGMGSV
jgi:uncharacterized membrane protein YeaQ/YmgE (transglycosylase-associated protein family)